MLVTESLETAEEKNNDFESFRDDLGLEEKVSRIVRMIMKITIISP